MRHEPDLRHTVWKRFVVIDNRIFEKDGRLLLERRRYLP